MDTEERQHLEQMRQASLKRFRALELRATERGLDTPIEILNEMESLRSQIQKLSSQLDDIDSHITASSSRVLSLTASSFLPKRLILTLKAGQLVFEEHVEWYYYFVIDAQIRDFIIEAKFINPSKGEVNDWTYGFAFRQAKVRRGDLKYNEFRFSVQSEDSTWILRLKSNDIHEQRFEVNLAQGHIPQLNTKPGGSNAISIIGVGATAFLFVNGRFVDTLNIGATLDAGKISVGFGFVGDTEQVVGKSLKYDYLNIWSVDL